MLIKCNICNKQFNRKPSHVGKNNYCSRKCCGLSKVGKSAWNKGIKGSVKPNSGSFKKGQNLGEKHPNWKGGVNNDISGYVRIYMPEHPFCDSHSYVFAHRYICECMLERFLNPEERPHHINEIKDDNRPKNIYLFSSHAKHTQYHSLKNKPKLKSNII